MIVSGYPSEDNIIIFRTLVNRSLQAIDLEEESIDYSMAADYIRRKYTVEQAVDDICSTLEIILYWWFDLQPIW